MSTDLVKKIDLIKEIFKSIGHATREEAEGMPFLSSTLMGKINGLVYCSYVAHKRKNRCKQMNDQIKKQLTVAH